MVAITEEQRLAIREFKSRINSYNFVIDHEEPVLPIGSIESYTAQLHLADEYLTNHPSLNHDEFNTIGLPLYVKKVMTRKIELEQLLVEPRESASTCNDLLLAAYRALDHGTPKDRLAILQQLENHFAMLGQPIDIKGK